MRKGIAASVILILACPAVNAFSLEFAPPATVTGATHVDDSQWLAVRLPPGSLVKLIMQADGNRIETNVTYSQLNTPASYFENPPDRQTSSTSASRNLVVLRAKAEGATLAVRHTGSLNLTGQTQLVPISGQGVSGFVEDGGATHDWSIWSEMSANGVALTSLDATLNLLSLSATAVEWFNMMTTCENDTDCFPGGGRVSQTVGLSGVSATSSSFVFERLEAPIILTANWQNVSLAVGGPSLQMSVDGWVHFPLAAGSTCLGCPALDGNTLVLSGNVKLSGVKSTPDGFSANITGTFDSARIDETWISPQSLGGATAIASAAIGLVVLLKLVVIPLFTRLSKQEALEHPKRQRIFAYIQEHPGANFREVARQTGIASGTVRHHLTVLERAGHLVEHAHQGTVRLFENHGKFDHNWADLVLLREPPLAQVNDWLKANPASPQKDVLEAFERLGWSRSTTQHRLARLVDGGLVSIRLQGRLKIYSPVDRARPKATVGLSPPPQLA